jgi:hypothetical protein
VNTARTICLWLTYAFLVLYPIQFFLAGYGIFTGKFDPHVIYGAGIMHLLIVLQLIAGGVGRLGWKWVGWNVLLNVLFVIQGGLPGASSDWVKAIHPLLAFSFWPYMLLLLLPPVKAAVANDDTPVPSTPV